MTDDGRPEDVLAALRQAAAEDAELPPAWLAGAFARVVSNLVGAVVGLPYGGQAQLEINQDDEQLSTATIKNPVKFAHELAGLYLDGAGELLHTLAALLLRADTTPYIGTAPIARSALEYAAKSWWLQLPDQTGRQRVGRAMGAMRGSFSEDESGDSNHIAGQLEEWASQQRTFRVSRGESKITAIIKAMHPGADWQYPYLSDASHGGPIEVLRVFTLASKGRGVDATDQWVRTWIATGAVLQACEVRSRLRGVHPWWDDMTAAYEVWAERIALEAGLT